MSQNNQFLFSMRFIWLFIFILDANFINLIYFLLASFISCLRPLFSLASLSKNLLIKMIIMMLCRILVVRRQHFYNIQVLWFWTFNVLLYPIIVLWQFYYYLNLRLFVYIIFRLWAYVPMQNLFRNIEIINYFYLQHINPIIKF